jgi:hypothetical protein
MHQVNELLVGVAVLLLEHCPERLGNYRQALDVFPQPLGLLLSIVRIARSTRSG